MIRSNLQVFGRNKEPDVIVLAQYLDVGLITGRDIIYQAFVLEVESVAVPGSASGIIENCLMGNLDAEDVAQDLSCFSGWYGKRNIKGQNQTEDIFAVMYSCQLYRRLIWRGEFQFFRFVMIFPVLVVDFEL